MTTIVTAGDVPVASEIDSTDHVLMEVDGATRRVALSTFTPGSSVGNYTSRAGFVAAVAAGLSVASGTNIIAAGRGYIYDGTNYIPDLPGFAPAVRPASIACWADTTAGHQAAWDYAHATGAPIILDADIEVVGTEYWGNLTIVDGGGTINCTGDGDFAISANGGARASQGCIIMRSANGNTDYGAGDNAAAKTQYLIRCAGRIKVRYTRSSTSAPRGPFQFTTLKEGSIIDMDCITDNSAITTTGAGTEATPATFYFYNRCTVRGRYEVILGNNAQTGGLWLQHVAIASSTVAEKSIFHLDGVEAINNGVDEACSIFTTGYPSGGARGYIHATGSITCYSSYGIGFTVLNNSLEDSEGFNVSLDSVVVYADNLQSGDVGVRYRSVHGQTGNINVIIENVAAGATAGQVIGAAFQDNDAIGARPQVSNLRVTIPGTLDCGNGIVDMVEGNAEIGNLITEYLSGATRPRMSVASANGMVIRGGDLCAGTVGAGISLYKITGGVVRGPLQETVHVGDDVTMYIDTDDFPSYALYNFSATVPTAFPETGRLYFKPTIIVSGSPAIQRIVNSAWADAANDIDYVVDYAASGGAPSNNDVTGTAAGLVKRTRVSGTTVDVLAIDDGVVVRASGTWTPSLTFDGAATGMTYSTQTGKWSISNGVLHIDANIVLTALGSSTGGASITLPSGLPGTQVITPGEGAATIRDYVNMATVTSPVARAETFFSATRLRLFTQASGGTSAMTEANFTNTSKVEFFGSFILA